MCGPKFCSMEITQQVRDYAAKLAEKEQVPGDNMEGSTEFVEEVERRVRLLPVAVARKHGQVIFGASYGQLREFWLDIAEDRLTAKRMWLAWDRDARTLYRQKNANHHEARSR
jgi:hypothetical protein